MQDISKPASSSFIFKDCSLVFSATGESAQTLNELHDRISQASSSSIYYHFWGSRLSVAYQYREYHNDFAHWAHSGLNDDILAERLDLIDPTDHVDIEQVKGELLELIENRLAEIDYVPWVKKEKKFYFIESKMIVFLTRFKMDCPQEALTILPQLPLSSFFYHTIDAARRLQPHHRNDFAAWFGQFANQYQGFIDEISKIDPYFISLIDLKKKWIKVFEEHFS